MMLFISPEADLAALAAEVPGAFGADVAAPVLFQAFARVTPKLEPQPPAPPLPAPPCRPVRQHQRGAGIKADIRRASHKRVARKPGISGGIRHHHHALTHNRMPAETIRPAGLGRTKPVARFEPLPVSIDQAHQRDGCIKAVGSKPGDDIEIGLGRRVEHIKAMQRGEPIGLVIGNRRKGEIRLKHGGVQSGQKGCVKQEP